MKDSPISKDEATSILNRIVDWLKIKINSIRIPRLMDFFINPKAKDPFNPTLEEALKDAPPKEGNWDRLGMGKSTSFGMKIVWLFVILIAVFAIGYGAEALKFFIDIISQGVMLIPLAIVAWFIWKKFKG